MTVVPNLVCQLDALLGEGPLWLPDEQALWFVDIKRGRLHRFNTANDICDTYEVGGQPSFIVRIDGGGLLVGSGRTLCRFEGGRLLPFLPLDIAGHDRINDATVDARGRLWFGTMDDAELRPTGAVFSLTQGHLAKTDWRAVVTNGPAVSCDGSWLYHVDSGERTIWRIALGRSGLASTGEIFVKLQDHEGYPDGVVVDSDDCLWVALWDGWAVRRYGSDGKLLLHVEMPCARPTKVAFGGPDLCTAYVTSARVGLDERALETQPLAGSVFSFRASSPGRVMPPAVLGDL